MKPRAPRPIRPSVPRRAPDVPARGTTVVRGYLKPDDRRAILDWLATVHPLWEQRYSTRRPPPPGEVQRPLLRPVYWLGAWQFACLGYYEPPRKVHDRAVAAEPFPDVLARIVRDVEARVRRMLRPDEIPPGWRLDTCLVNFYGSRLQDGREVDAARVGDHRDWEPGPVASLSLGERAFFQFVRPGRQREVVRTLWLGDGDLQILGGPWKERLLHRVQRVEDRLGLDLPPAIEGFRTRRINLTFRHVPPEHVVPFGALGEQAREDVREYVETLATHSAFFRAALDAAPPPPR